MPPKKRDKVPVRRQHNTFKLPIPLPTPSQYSAIKACIQRRAAAGGYPEGLPSADAQLKHQQREESLVLLQRSKLLAQIEFQKGLKKEPVVQPPPSPPPPPPMPLPDLDPALNPEVQALDKAVDLANEEKKELFWLLKQVITQEAGQGGKPP